MTDFTFILYMRWADLEYLHTVDFQTHTFERKYLLNVGNYLTLSIL